jgi:hypothetical protein
VVVRCGAVPSESPPTRYQCDAQCCRWPEAHRYAEADLGALAVPREWLDAAEEAVREEAAAGLLVPRAELLAYELRSLAPTFEAWARSRSSGCMAKASSTICSPPTLRECPHSHAATPRHFHAYEGRHRPTHRRCWRMAQDPKANYDFPGMAAQRDWCKTLTHQHTHYYGCARCGLTFRSPHAVYTHLAKVHP